MKIWSRMKSFASDIVAIDLDGRSGRHFVRIVRVNFNVERLPGVQTGHRDGGLFAFGSNLGMEVVRGDLQLLYLTPIEPKGGLDMLGHLLAIVSNGERDDPELVLLTLKWD